MRGAPAPVSGGLGQGATHPPGGRRADASLSLRPGGHRPRPLSLSPLAKPPPPLRPASPRPRSDGGPRRYANDVMVMTGHLKSPDSSPNMLDGEKTNGSAMHTLAPARSPNQPLLHHLQNANSNGDIINGIEAEYPIPVPFAPSATPVPVVMDSNDSMLRIDGLCTTNFKEKFETLRSLDQQSSLNTEKNGQDLSPLSKLDSNPSMMITSELLRLIPGENDTNDEDGLFNEENNCSFNEMSTDEMGHYGRNSHCGINNGPKTWSQQDMENALDALRNHNMSLTKASSTFGIPSTTLWQRAHRLGIDTPKKEGPSKSWSEGNLHNALQALRTGTISANKASKAYGIPSSTLYKIARREGIRLAAPFNAAPTAWRPGDLERALHSIRSGHSSVQRASTEFGIPTGTLYGRCKREGIELSRSNPTPWSEDAMGEALEAVRIGQMSINQAAIHYNLPYSSLYGRFKRCKYEGDSGNSAESPVPVHTIQELHSTQQMTQTPILNTNHHDHNMAHDNTSRHLYSPYQHHSVSIPPSMHEHSEPTVSHNNQDCVSIS